MRCFRVLMYGTTVDYQFVAAEDSNCWWWGRKRSKWMNYSFSKRMDSTFTQRMNFTRRKQQSYQMKKEVNSILTCNQIDKNNKQKTNQKKTKVLSHVTFHVWHVYGVCLKLTSPFTRWNRLSLSETNTVLLLLHIAADWEWVIITIAFIVLYNE